MSKLRSESGGPALPSGWACPDQRTSAQAKESALKQVELAGAYVTRKKSRSAIVLVFLTVVLSCLSLCLGVLQTTSGMERTLFQAARASLSIRRKDGQDFPLAWRQKLSAIREIQALTPHFQGLARLSAHEVVEGPKGQDIPQGPNLKNLVDLEACPDSKEQLLFSSGVFRLIEGRPIEGRDRHKILIHEALAKKNKLKLGDRLPLQGMPMQEAGARGRELPFEIVGIFKGKKQETPTGLSSDWSENVVFTDYAGSQEAMGRTRGQELVSRLLIQAKTAQELAQAEKKVQKSALDWDQLVLEQNSQAFEEAKASVSGVRSVLSLMTYALLAGGTIVLSLLLLLWLRDRLYEIGILLSLGRSKGQILVQFLLELFLLSLPALLLSLALAPIFSGLFGGLVVEGGGPGSGPGLNQAGVLSFSGLLSLVQSLGTAYLLLLVIMLLAVLFSAGWMLRKKPKDLLSQMS